MACFSLSDLILLISVQQVTAIRSVRSFLSLLNEVGIEKNRVLLLVNRYDESNTITSRKISEMLNLNVAYQIPFDQKSAEKAANLGIPFLAENQKLEISKAILGLVNVVKNRIPEKEKSES